MASEIGQALREARIGRGIELSEVEQETKIRAGYLRAIEEERWDLLPGDPYTRGFLRTYAEFLELDADALVAAYKSRVAPVEEPTPLPETMLPQRGLAGRAPIGLSPALLVGIAVAALIVVGGVIALTGGSDGGGKRSRQKPIGGASSTTAPQTTNAQETGRPARVSLELRSTDAVWVCLVEKHGPALIDAETLAPGDRRGPFKGREFKVTFGNGAVEMTVDDRPVAVPDLGEPLGYLISSKGVDRLGPSSRPTCS
ncbi:MAG: helix-turn-helix domain-containing protein [Solirubrobacterales bacterium]